MGFFHILKASKSTLFVLTAFAMVLFIRVVWMEWSGKFTMPFLRTGRIEELVFLLLVGAAIAMVVGKLLMWEFRAETKPRARPPRRRQ